MRELETALAEVRNAWIAGRSALEHAPPAWREAVGEDELALIALAGHVTDVLTQRAPGTALVDRPLLPALAAPLVPEPLRPRFRRLLARPKNLPSLEQHLIALVGARGYAAHPADWMPDAKDDWAPDLYAPWLDWVRAEVRAAPADADINAENYDQWSWTERRAALWALRAHDPNAARAIIAAKAAGEPAERRVRLIELLENRLSEADAEFLESLATDRSDRVKSLARIFLSRLGRGGGEAVAGLAAELAAMVELQRTGLINRRMRLRIGPLKTNAQVQRRRELMRLVGLNELAGALNASEAQLVESVPDGAPEEVASFMSMAADTGTDAAARALLDVALREGETPLAFLQPLTARLTGDDRIALIPQLLRLDGHLFETTLSIAGEAVGCVPLPALTASHSYSALKSNIEAAAHGDENARRVAMPLLEQALPRVGLLLDAAGAKALLAQICSWGLSPAEPLLDMLHFNAALASNNLPETTP